MATFLFVPLPERGHVNPTLKAARDLRQRGNRVVYATMPDAEPLIRAEDFEFHPLLPALCPPGYRNKLLEQTQVPSWLGRVRGLLAEKRHFDAIFQAMVQGELHPVFQRIRPDLVVCDTMMCPAAIIAHSLGLRVLLFNTTYLSRYEPGEPPIMSGLIPDGTQVTRTRTALEWLGPRLSAHWQDVKERVGLSSRERGSVRELARRNGLPPEQLDLELELALIKRPELVLCPREFAEFGQPRTRGHYLYVEPCIDLGRTEPDFPMSRLEGSAPLVLMSLGSMHHDTRRARHFLELARGVAARRPGWNVVLATGQAGASSPEEPGPPNLMVMQYVPQLRLLRHAAAMVTHGGFNSAKECIYFGVPMVVVPCQFDQAGLAARVVHHRLGVRASLDRLTAGRLVANLEEVLTHPTYRSACQAMGERFREAERTARIADTLERFLPS